MQEIRTKIVAKLLSDGTLYPGLIPGGVLDRPIKAGTAQGSTPDVFYIKPGDAARIPRLHETIVVSSPGEVDPPDGPAGASDLVLRNSFIRIFYYVPATAAGKVRLDQIDARVRFLLSGWQITLSTAYPITVSLLEMTEAIDSDEFPGNLVCYRRLVAEYLRLAA